MKSNISKSYKYQDENNIVSKVKITVDGYKCERCKHEWVPRIKSYPNVCPKCKSAWWDKPRKGKTGRG